MVEKKWQMTEAKETRIWDIFFSLKAVTWILSLDSQRNDN